MFGPEYRTTAANRNARMVNRLRDSSREPLPHQAGLSRHNAATGRESIPADVEDRNYFSTRQPHHVTFQEGGVSEVAQSTRIDVAVLSSRFSSSDCLMDLENDVIEQVASVAPDGAVHLSQGQGHSPLRSADSSATQYADMADTTYRVNGSLPRACGPALQPHGPFHAFRPSIRCPQNVMAGPARHEDFFSSIITGVKEIKAFCQKPIPWSLLSY